MTDADALEVVQSEKRRLGAPVYLCSVIFVLLIAVCIPVIASFSAQTVLLTEIALALDVQVLDVWDSKYIIVQEGDGTVLRCDYPEEFTGKLEGCEAIRLLGS